MKTKIFSYRFAKEILEHPLYRDAYNELLFVCRNCPLPVYADKSVHQRGKDVVQQIMNSYFFKMFESCGWETEPLATPDDREDALRADFRKRFADRETGEYLLTLQIEVEFGNVASSYRNYFKFQLSFSYGLADVCILIVPCYHLSMRIDSGVSYFEKTCREIPAAKLSVTVPTMVIGLSDEDTEPWDVKAVTTDLAVLKNSNKDVAAAHYAIVQQYIDHLPQRGQ